MAENLQSTQYLCDFIYLDNKRISFYLAQLFPDGLLVQVKRTAKESSSDTLKGGVSVKIASLGKDLAENSERGLERSFDRSSGGRSTLTA
ncbi:hypothetical protein K6W12_27195 [Burkholderia multivorans]|uniref:DUF6414 family protein n=1 Tax=Burkholderia multivorans TaxID=87883 RepID=UPI001C93CCBA|nr:hypothetical protein [Burkholderia multivorans]MBY4674314.1 hypothetical protein [Burkholderia multivorans]